MHLRSAIPTFFALSFAVACGSSQGSTQEPVTGSGEPEPITVDHGSEPTPSADGLVVGTDACTSDADCVPDGCCHPSACVAQGNAQACGDVMCTTDCRFGTLDCGGSCLCHEGHCAARLSVAPAMDGTAVQ